MWRVKSFFFFFFSFKVEILSCGIYRFLFIFYFLLLMSVFKSSSVTKLWHFNLCNSSSCANVVSTSECLFLLRYMVLYGDSSAQHVSILGVIYYLYQNDSEHALRN